MSSSAKIGAKTEPRPTIDLMAGLPGSGKTTWLEGKPGVLSSDALRQLLADDPDNQEIHKVVFGALRSLLKIRLELRRPVTYIDATNLTPRERAPYVKLAILHDCSIEAVFFDVPLKECQRRNRLRRRVVPDDVIENMARHMIPPHASEGFSRVTLIR
jgi:predicted kinase